MLVRTSHVPPWTKLTCMLYSRPIGAERRSPGSRGRIPTRRSQGVSEGHTGDSPGRDRVVGQGLLEVSGLLAEWARRDGQVDDRADGQRAGVRRRAAGSVLLLFARFRGPQQPAFHLPHPRVPASTQIPDISIDPRPPPSIEPGYRARVTREPDGRANSRAAQVGRRDDGDRDRRSGRMQGRGTVVCDSVCAGAVRRTGAGGQVFYHWATRAADQDWIPSPPARGLDECLRFARRPPLSGKQRHPIVPETRTIRTRTAASGGGVAKRRTHRRVMPQSGWTVRLCRRNCQVSG